MQVFDFIFSRREDLRDPDTEKADADTANKEAEEDNEADLSEGDEAEGDEGDNNEETEEGKKTKKKKMARNDDKKKNTSETAESSGESMKVVTAVSNFLLNGKNLLFVLPKRCTLLKRCFTAIHLFEHNYDLLDVLPKASTAKRLDEFLRLLDNPRMKR